MDKSLSKNLKDWRKLIGATQSQAAGLLLIPLPTYRKWEQGRREPACDVQAFIYKSMVQSAVEILKGLVK